jgi:hypothetical protein
MSVVASITYGGRPGSTVIEGSTRNEKKEKGGKGDESERKHWDTYNTHIGGDYRTKKKKKKKEREKREGSPASLWNGRAASWASPSSLFACAHISRA